MPLCLTFSAAGPFGIIEVSERGKGRHMADVGSGLRWEGKAVASGAQKETKLEMTTTPHARHRQRQALGIFERGFVLFWFRPAPGTGGGRQKQDWWIMRERDSGPNNCVLANL